MRASGHDVHVDELETPAGRRVWTLDIPADAERTIRPHVHDVHELLWGATGTRTVEIDGNVMVVPPTLGVWLPAGTVHSGYVSAATGYRSTAIEARGPTAIPLPPPLRAVRAIGLTPAYRALVAHLDRGDLEPAARARAEQVLLDLLEPQRSPTVALPLPRDDRLRRIADALIADPASQADLAAWGRATGASVRTLTRRFVAETGYTFAEWRTHARVRAALVLLAGGTTVATTARRVGYLSTSSFVRAFRNTTGQTPGTYADGSASWAVYLDGHDR